MRARVYKYFKFPNNFRNKRFIAITDRNLSDIQNITKVQYKGHCNYATDQSYIVKFTVLIKRYTFSLFSL